MIKAYYVLCYKNGSMKGRWYRVNKCDENTFTFKDSEVIHSFDNWQFKIKMVKK